MLVNAIGVFRVARVDTTCTFCNSTLFSVSVSSDCAARATPIIDNIKNLLMSLFLIINK